MFQPEHYWLARRIDKKPIDPGWARLSAGDYKDWRADRGDVALRCGGQMGICVLDVDVDKATGEVSEETIAELLAMELPDTLKVPSRRGWHYFFEYHGEPLGTHIRFQGRGDLDFIYDTLIFLWPDEKGQLSHYDTSQIAALPQSVIDRLVKPEAKPNGNGAAPGHEGVQGNRNDSMSRFCYRLMKSGLDYDIALAAMRGENLRYRPPLDDGELLAILGGKLRAGIVADAVEHEQLIEETRNLPRGESIAELRARDYRPLPALCGPIPGGSITVISGAHKAGKSLFAAHIGARVAAGKPLGDWVVPNAVPVLYVDGENTSRIQFERILATNFPRSENFRIAHRDWLREQFGQFKLTDPACQQWLGESPERLIILDSLLSLNPPGANVSMNDADYIQNIMPCLDALTAKGTGVLILHNLNKAQQSHGTNALAWRADRLWHLYRYDGFKPATGYPLEKDPKATAGLVLRALDGDRSLQPTQIDSEWQFFMEKGWIKD